MTSVQSVWSYIIARVPQGSLLGPRLFINDMFVDNESAVRLSCFCIIAEDPNAAAELLNADLEG